MDNLNDGMKPVTEADIKQQHGPYSRVSKDIIESFMNRNVEMCQLNPDHYGRTKQQLRVQLTNYVKAKDLRIQLFEVQSVLYIKRTDWDERNKVHAAEGLAAIESTLKQV